MRLKALLVTAALAVASAGTAAANPQTSCDDKTWLARIVCKVQAPATATADKNRDQVKDEDPAKTDGWSFIRALLAPRRDG